MRRRRRKRQRKDVVPITECGRLRGRIEALRQELHRLYERDACPETILAVSRELDALIIRLLQEGDEPDGDRGINVR